MRSDQVNSAANSQPDEINPQFSWWLDLFRAGAAALVALGHLRDGVFVAYGDLDAASRGSVNFSMFALTRLGLPAVIVFFVLSGYLVGGSAFSAWRKGRLDYRRYFADRASRMWTVVLPVLLITAILGLARQPMLSAIQSTDMNLGVGTFLGNCFFLQTIAVPVFGANWPLWSLANEVCYYLLWPVILWLLASRLSRASRVLALLALAVLFTMAVPHIALYFPVWLLGVGLRFVPSMTKGRAWVPFLIVVAVVFACFSSYKSLAADFGLAVVFGLLIAHLRGGALWIPTSRFTKPVSWLAASSFSLYALHYPLLGYLIAWGQAHGWGFRLKSAGWTEWGVYAVCAILIYACCALFYFLFEARTKVVRGWLYRLLGTRGRDSVKTDLAVHALPSEQVNLPTAVIVRCDD